MTPAAVRAVNSPRERPAVASKLRFGKRSLEQLKGHPTHQEDARLGVFGLGQFRVRAPKANRGQVIAQRRLGPIKPGFALRECLGEIPAHADHLGALPCE